MFECLCRAAGGRGGPAGSGPHGPGSQGMLGSELARTRADLAEVREVSPNPIPIVTKILHVSCTA